MFTGNLITVVADGALSTEGDKGDLGKNHSGPEELLAN